jgi:predicted nucleic acid-binding protein
MRRVEERRPQLTFRSNAAALAFSADRQRLVLSWRVLNEQVDVVLRRFARRRRNVIRASTRFTD